MGAIMEFATENRLNHFLSTLPLKDKSNFLMAFIRKDMVEIFY